MNKAIMDVINKLKLEDDKEFVLNQLKRFPAEKHNEVFKGYIDAWRVGVDEEEVSYKKQNAGRYKANQYLLYTEHKRNWLERE